MNTSADASGNIMPEFYEVKPMRTVKTGVTTTRPASTGISVKIAEDDDVTDSGDGEEPAPHKQRDAAIKSTKQSVLLVHATTLPHLTFVEKIILDCLIQQGRAVVVAAGA